MIAIYATNRCNKCETPNHPPARESSSYRLWIRSPTPTSPTKMVYLHFTNHVPDRPFIVTNFARSHDAYIICSLNLKKKKKNFLHHYYRCEPSKLQLIYLLFELNWNFSFFFLCTWEKPSSRDWESKKKKVALTSLQRGVSFIISIITRAGVFKHELFA